MLGREALSLMRKQWSWSARLGGDIAAEVAANERHMPAWEGIATAPSARADEMPTPPPSTL